MLICNQPFFVYTSRRRFVGYVMMAMVMAALLMPGGCASGRSDPAGMQQLNAGYRALDSQQFDQAQSIADQYLRENPSGPSAAEALYLRGRALSEKTATSASQAQANWTAARQAYVDALQLHPSGQLEAYIRTSYGNAAYFQDDFVTAADQWTQAYRELDRPDLRAWVLYRLGKAQQRMGQFAVADRTFARVQQQFANTQQASLAKSAEGAREFYVQLATFNAADGAERAVQQARQYGMVPTVAVNPSGQHVVHLGPTKTYEQARTLLDRAVGVFSDAMIVP